MKLRKIIRRSVFVLFCLCLLFLIIGIVFFQNIVVTDYVVELEGIDSDVRIVLLSDLHCHATAGLRSELLKKISEAKPDLIVIAGDMLDRNTKAEQLPPLYQFAEELCQIAPVYYSMGNHEQDFLDKNGTDFLDGIAQSGVTILDDAYLDLTVNGATFRLGGMDRYAYRDGTDEFFPGVEPFMSEFCDTELPKILLSHRPESFSFKHACEEWDVDLILSGHTHGGMVRLPGVGGLIAPIQGLFPKTDYGEYTFYNTKMIVTSGVAAYGIIPRVYNPPEICVITIKNSKQNEGI